MSKLTFDRLERHYPLARRRKARAFARHGQHSPQYQAAYAYTRRLWLVQFWMIRGQVPAHGLELGELYNAPEA